VTIRDSDGDPALIVDWRNISSRDRVHIENLDGIGVAAVYLVSYFWREAKEAGETGVVGVGNCQRCPRQSNW
jgi:hypothetical protein